MSCWSGPAGIATEGLAISVPHEVRDPERHRVERGRPPRTSQHDGERDDGDHDRAGPGAEQRDGAGEQAEPIEPVERAVAVGEDELHQPESDATDEGDLERPQDVLVAGAEHHQRPRGQGGDPRTDPVPSHDHTQQRRRQEVQRDRGPAVRQVRVQAEEVPDDPVVDDGKGHQVLVVRPEEVGERAEVAVVEEPPLVEEEPPGPFGDEEGDGGDDEEDDERGEREAARCAPDGFRHRVRRRVLR